MVRSPELPGLTSISEATCWELLHAHRVGRIAVAVGSQPDIFPVNYVIDDGEIVIRTAEGTKLAAAIMGDRVAFEIDELHRDTHTGWSVVVHGTAHEARDVLAVMHDSDIETSPWADGAKERVLRITPVAVSGRSIGLSEDEVAPR